MEEQTILCPPCRSIGTVNGILTNNARLCEKAEQQIRLLRVSGQQADSFAAPEAPSASSQITLTTTLQHTDGTANNRGAREWAPAYR